MVAENTMWIVSIQLGWMNNQVLPNQALLLLEWPSHGGWWLLTHLQPQWRTRWNSDRRIHVGREGEIERNAERERGYEISWRISKICRWCFFLKTYVELLTSWHHVSEMKKPLFLKIHFRKSSMNVDMNICGFSVLFWQNF